MILLVIVFLFVVVVGFLFFVNQNKPKVQSKDIVKTEHFNHNISQKDTVKTTNLRSVKTVSSRKVKETKEDDKSLNLNEPFPFYPSYLMTKREQQLYWRLVETLPECVIMSQVQITRILRVKKGNNFNKWNNTINRLSLDFVVCRKDTYPLAVIELDDSSHDNERQQARDDKKDKALTDAGIKIIRWREIPDAETIKTALQGLI